VRIARQAARELDPVVHLPLPRLSDEIRGPLLTAVTLLGLELATRQTLTIPDGALVLLLLTVVYSGFRGGLRSAIVSAGFTVLYGLSFFSTPIVPLRYSDENALRLLVLSLAAPGVAIMVGALKGRVERTAVGAERRERDYRLLLASVQDGVVVTAGPEHTIVEVNPALCRMTGYTRTALIGLRPPYPFWPLEDGADLRDSMRRTLDGEPAEIDAHYVRADGSGMPVIVTRSPVRDASGEVTGVISTVKDVTERRRAEEALHDAEEQLRHAQKLEAVGRLAGGIAHDFNNLLTAIVGYADILREDLRGHRLEEEVEELSRTAERATALTGQLLAFSRRQVREPTLVDVNELIRRLEPILRRMLGEPTELLLALGTDLRPVRVDPGQLEQVIVNLAVNARDAMPDGGLLTIETAFRPPEADEAEARPAGSVVLSVSDTGVGMDEETRRQLFEPFFTTKEPGRGTGLGLATSYGIVTGSGGTIVVESEPGGGATFRIELPAVAEPMPVMETSPEASAEPPPRGGNETILVVEDTAPVRALATEVLRRYGYRVLEAPGASQAMLLAERHPGPIHLLLTDVAMPEASGPQLAARLLERRSEIRVLYMSGYMEDAIARDGVLEPGVRFLQKPFAPEALARRVRGVLDEPEPPRA
jgi:PAS domain S-box-containing protein